MAGTGWKAAGAIGILLGAVAILLGVVGAAFGGVVANDAVSDASEDCGGLFEPRCDPTAADRAEAGVLMVIGGGTLAAIGLVLATVGIVFVFVGVSAARREERELMLHAMKPN